MATPAHSKIINNVAREVLKPIGVKRKGQSRVWFDDNGWWIFVIEFQPSSWSKGTYLNVGVNWLWHPKEYFSFDLGYREESFIEHKSDAQFEPRARDLAIAAKAKVLEMRNNLANLEAAKTYTIGAYCEEPETIWSQFHQGMICALAGSLDDANAYFMKVLESPDERDWAIALKQSVNDVLNMVSNAKDFKSYVCNIVNEARKIKKLEDWHCEFA
jgi:hypothetical protein